MWGHPVIALLGGLIALAGCTTLPPAAAPPAAETSRPVEAEPGYDPTSGPRPLAVLVITNPWAGVIGSDSPIFALYDDRTVVYPHDRGDGVAETQTVTLSPEEFQQLADRLALTPEFLDLKPFYRTSPLTDQPIAVIFLSNGVTRHTVSVYGLPSGWWHGPATLMLQPIEPIPAEAERLIEAMTDYDRPDGTLWKPPFMELVVAVTPGRARRRWMRGLPGLRHPTTRKWPGAPPTYSIYLSWNQWKQLTRSAEGKPKNLDKIFRIDGKNVEIRLARPVFYGEALWQADVAASVRR